MYRILICFLIIIVTQLYAFSGEYTCKKLKSGQTVIVAEIKDNPIVSINSWVRTGSINENDTNSGAAHFLEHLFFKGSKNVPTGEFDKILESKGAVTNAATSKDYTQFYITIPSSEFELALKLHSDMLLNPLIPIDELEKERFVVLEEIARGLDNPSNVLYNNLFKLVYNNHPYMRPVIGTKEVISNISREEIFDFYNSWYVPSNMITVISGDIDADYAIKQVEKAFSAKGAKTKTPHYPSISPITKQISINENKEIAQGYMAIAYRAPKFTGSKDTFALDILSVILGESNSSVLNTELKEKKQLVSGVNASYAQYLDDGMFIVSAKFEPLKNVTEIQNAIFDEIEKIKNTGITGEQLQKAKNMIRTSTGYSRESALNIAQELGFFAFYYNNPKMYNEYLKKIDSITPGDVVRAANKYLDREKTAISTVLPKGYVEISEISSRPKTELGAPVVIEQTENETKYSLNNNAVLIVRKNKQNSIIALEVYAKGGSFLSKKPGVSYLAAKSALRGTKNRTYDEINNFLDENGIDFSINSNPDAFNISLLATKNRLNEAFEILDEVINYPSFSDTEINKVKKQYAEYVNSLSDRPLALAMDEFNGAAYKGYPYSHNNQTTIKYINDITRDEIIEYYNKILDSKNLVITLAGDVDENAVIREFERIFEN
ncbi:MAG: insulinase family protein, partial [Candidatus Gastranaerophilales bacterium]|nr:insulinase family protein [Candidatus Gastranaerophilales bacterium]